MITALVVSHNASAHIARCLDSLVAEAAAAAAALDIVVVDNASSDGTADLVRGGYPQVVLEALDENLGFGAANNRAARRARGDALLLINADAWLGPGALAALSDTLASDPRLALVAPQLRYPGGALQTTWAPTGGALGEAIQLLRNRMEGRPFNHRLLPPLLRLITGPGWYSAACLLLRRRAFETVGGFDERFFLYFEDVDLCRRLHAAGWKFAQAADAKVFHVRGASRDHGRHELRYRSSQLAYYAAARPAWESWLLRRRLRRRLRALPDDETRAGLAALLDG